jgi:hypothetical protein
MTLSEFKAWFEGYTEGLDGAPTEKQFKRIKAKVAEITGAPISHTVFVDRYHHYWQQWGQPILFGGPTSGSAGFGISGVGALTEQRPPVLNAEWDSHSAMYAVGKADAVLAA